MTLSQNKPAIPENHYKKPEVLGQAQLLHNERAAFTVKEFLALVGISRSTFYKEVQAGRIKLRKVGNRSLVLRADGEAWLNGLPHAD